MTTRDTLRMKDKTLLRAQATGLSPRLERAVLPKGDLGVLYGDSIWEGERCRALRKRELLQAKIAIVRQIIWSVLLVGKTSGRCGQATLQR